MRALATLLLAAVAFAADVDISGNWSGKTKLSVDGKVEEDTIYLSLKQTGNIVTGTAGPAVNDQNPIKTGKIEGRRLTLEVPVPNGVFNFDITLEGDHLKGDIVATAQGQTLRATMEAYKVK